MSGDHAERSLRLRRAARQGLVALTSAGAYAACTAVLSWGVRAPLAHLRVGPPALEDYMTLGAAALAWLCLTWVTLLVLAHVAVAASRGAHVRWAHSLEIITPSLLRRLAAAAVGTALVVPVSASAAAASSPAAAAPITAVSSTGGTPHGSGPQRVAPLVTIPLLDRPAPSRTETDSPPTTTGPHVVQEGDTLWDIAASALPDTASDQQIDAAWPHWYDTNSEVIGTDPNLLRPGQVLRPPGPG